MVPPFPPFCPPEGRLGHRRSSLVLLLSVCSVQAKETCILRVRGEIEAYMKYGGLRGRQEVHTCPGKGLGGGRCRKENRTMREKCQKSRRAMRKDHTEEDDVFGYRRGMERVRQRGDGERQGRRGEGDGTTKK